MILGFRCKDTAAVANGRTSRRFAKELRAAIERKLQVLDAATSLEDLRHPAGNHLEALHGDRAGQHSIRVNRQWRICFVWTEKGPSDVEVVDYH